MHWFRFVAFLVVFVASLTPQSASARRTVIDASATMGFDSYCSPGEAATNGCSPQALPFSLHFGGQTFNSYYINSNGVLSFGSIAPQLAAENAYLGNFPPQYFGPGSGTFFNPAPPLTSLSQYNVPVISPFFSDGSGYISDFLPPFFSDGNLVDESFTTADSLQIIWFPCEDPLNCGLSTMQFVQAGGGDQFFQDEIFQLGFNALGCPCNPYPGNGAVFQAGRETFIKDFYPETYSLTLTQLGSDVRLSFNYGPGAKQEVGTSGFNLPSGFYETTGPLKDRSFLFNSLGQLISAPEPGTWATMMIGFGAIGLAIRRKRNSGQLISA